MATPNRLVHSKDGIPTLSRLCIDVLSHRTDLLDCGVGFLDPISVRQILAGVPDAKRLAAIEDATLASCGHPLTWYTWHLWHRLYTRDYGPLPHGIGLPLLPKPPPPDYQPPSYTSAPAAHYRRVYEAKGADEAVRRSQTAAGLRQRYQAAAAAVERKRVQVTDQLPPPKRSRTATGSSQRVPGGGRLAGAPAPTSQGAKARLQLLGKPKASKPSNHLVRGPHSASQRPTHATHSAAAAAARSTPLHSAAKPLAGSSQQQQPPPPGPRLVVGRGAVAPPQFRTQAGSHSSMSTKQHQQHQLKQCPATLPPPPPPSSLLGSTLTLAAATGGGSAASRRPARSPSASSSSLHTSAGCQSTLLPKGSSRGGATGLPARA